MLSAVGNMGRHVLICRTSPRHATTDAFQKETGGFVVLRSVDRCLAHPLTDWKDMSRRGCRSVVAEDCARLIGFNTGRVKDE
jgi:hypothetical protein